MAKRVKFSLLKIFFNFFSFLADKTGGWKIFVTPKLLLGTALLLSGNACAQKTANQNDSVNLQTIDTIIEKEIDEDSIICYAYYDIKPQFPGGDRALMKWLNENIKYPEIAQKLGIQGRVYVNFVVEKDGSITNVKIARGVHPILDEEAIRLVKSMPKWKNEAEKSRDFTLPITFVLK